VHKMQANAELTAGIAHEINTPLQFLTDSIYFLRDGMAELSGPEDLMQELPDAIARAEEGTRRVVAIVRAMKEFAHPGRREMMAADLNQAILTTLTVCRHVHKYVAKVESELGELPRVICHVGDLNQVFL